MSASKSPGFAATIPLLTLAAVLFGAAGGGAPALFGAEGAGLDLELLNGLICLAIFSQCFCINLPDRHVGWVFDGEQLKIHFCPI